MSVPGKPEGFVRRISSLKARGRGIVEAFKLFCTMAACAVSLGRREDEYLEAVAGWEREELEVLVSAFGLLVEEMERDPHRDLLGPAYEVLGSPGDRAFRGEFYTPRPLSDLVADVQIGDARWPEDRPLELLEPASGSGGMVLAFVGAMAERGIPPSRVRVECWDIARTACDMAYTNLALHGVPARIIWGNTLTREIFRAWTTPFWDDPHLVHLGRLFPLRDGARRRAERKAG